MCWGQGDRAQRLMTGLRERSELGIEVVGWTGQIAPASDRSPNGRVEIEMGSISAVQPPGLLTKVAILKKKAEPEELTQPTTVEGELTRDIVANHLLELARRNGVHRVIVAMPDRRGMLPVEELLDLRLAGVKVEEATSWLEKISGKIEVEHLYPSWLIFAQGFRFSPFFRVVRRLLNFSVAFVGLLLSLPLIPLHCVGSEAEFSRSGVV